MARSPAPLSMTPVPWHPDPAAITPDPSAPDPDDAGARRHIPMASDPDPSALPFPGAGNPHVLGARGNDDRLGGWRRRSGLGGSHGWFFGRRGRFGNGRWTLLGAPGQYEGSGRYCQNPAANRFVFGLCHRLHSRPPQFCSCLHTIDPYHENTTPRQMFRSGEK